MPWFTVALHHSEPADPTLLHWITETIDSVLSIGPVWAVAGIGVFIVALPVALFVLALRRRWKAL